MSRKRKTNQIKIALIQAKASEDSRLNLYRTLEKIKKASERGAKLICLQELFCSRYFPQIKDRRYFKLAEPASNFMTKVLTQIAKEEKVVLIVPFFEFVPRGTYYNSAAVIDADGKTLGVYRKTHIPYDPGFYEKFYFKPGNSGYKVFKTKYANISVLICWDQWFPEAARAAALRGADIIFYPTAIGWNKKGGRHREEEAAWQTIQRSHAIANGVYVASANRVGVEKNLTFWGQSFVSDPFGTLIAKAGAAKEEILFADCDLSKIDQTRKVWPFFRDRRVDAYQSLRGLAAKRPGRSNLRT